MRTCLTILKRKKGPKPWRFSLDILSGDKVEQINHCLSIFNDHDLINSWEWIKSDIQEMAREYTAFRQKQVKTEVKSLHFSLRRLNSRIYKGENLDLDRERLESRLFTLKECEWFDQSVNHEDDWICTEGTMAPSFLHLEDEKSSLIRKTTDQWECGIR